MNKVCIDVKALEEKQYDYLKETLPDCEIDSFDKLYSYLHDLKDVEMHISHIEAIGDKTTDIIRLINEVHNDYHNFDLIYDLDNQPKEKIVLDIDRLNEEKHDYLIELFDLPDYYGRNLDALYDCMSEKDSTTIYIINMDNVNEFSLNVLQLLDDVADEYGNLEIIHQDEDNQ